MKIIVCVKQVPDTSGRVAVKPDGTLDRGSMATIANPDDMSALEAALRIKDERPDCKVIVMSMGPGPAAGMLHEMLAMGADEAVLISAREFGGSDTFATSQIIAAIRRIGLDKDDMVFCGRQAIDGDTAQVGPQIAEKLDIPQISYVAEMQLRDGAVTCKRLLEDGYMIIKAETPCLLTCVRELGEPRYMTVKGILSFDKKPYTVFDYAALKDEPLIEADTIGLKGSPTNIFKSFTPPVKGAGVMLEGCGKDSIDRLFAALREKHII
ncbi:MAG: electron transfer flavoprotein subunit beta/FixA family protein [Clostridia bacterium]|nr:electron transfer flavoprotein subunit beta/FixA family protein [Clostridia bacterium]